MASTNISSIANSLIHYSSDDSTRTFAFATFSSLAWYNAIELIILCFVSFKRWRGCYFWSLLVASFSIIPYCLGFILLFFPTGVTPYVCVTLIIISWCGMITGQSMVLWSRLHLLLRNTRVLWNVLWMIIIDAILLHVPTAVLLFGAVGMPTGPFAHGYNIMERIQVVGFCIQELVISSIYVWEAIHLLRLRPGGQSRGILSQLLIINIVILFLDVAIVVIEYVGYYALQVMFKPVAYSIKLKLEYAILGKLITVARESWDDREVPPCDYGTNETSTLPSSQGTTSNFISHRHNQSQYVTPRRP
ncbi:uncharacterized protein N7484_009334 [Penicillium longicatenatum]|uniref:uncharacterized protein n=1 Tax=Penicillium longicatenatum TaxID=1561947 RepID=UPI002547582B|nr:uncharacterized protein N7484_009334 [Penicillium longicatenatum]KAJ5636021.1 hypothetical protein N7484_009334 [Penicillium longicatenatum]